jgi:hypothetical protein
MTTGLALKVLRKPGGDVLERPILQQSREQQVPRFEECHIFGIHELSLRKQSHNLHVEQGGGHDHELTRRVEARDSLKVLHIGEELIGDGSEGNLCDVELALTDEAQQKVKRSIKVGERNLKTIPHRGALHLGKVERARRWSHGQ